MQNGLNIYPFNLWWNFGAIINNDELELNIVRGEKIGLYIGPVYTLNLKSVAWITSVDFFYIDLKSW